MSKSTNRLIFLGTDDFSATALAALLEDGRNISLVITRPDSKSGRGQKDTSPKVKLLAEKAGLRVIQPAKVGDVADKLAQVEWAILASYGQIIPAGLIDKMPGGIINVHPSLLPLYRGPSPIETAILNGDDETGVSLMKLSASMDAGPVYVQEEVALNPTTDRLELYRTLAEKGSELLVRNLDNIISGHLEPTAQQDSKATYTKLLTKEEGLIDWNKPAEQIEREVRAHLGWPKSRAKLKRFDVILTRTRVAASSNDGLLVQPCGEGWLEIQELIAPSGRSMTGADFIRGYLVDK